MMSKEQDFEQMAAAEPSQNGGWISKPTPSSSRGGRSSYRGGRGGYKRGSFRGKKRPSSSPARGGARGKKARSGSQSRPARGSSKGGVCCHFNQGRSGVR